jgi:hypothetical protein
MVSYQLFTQTAVVTFTSYASLLWPSLGAWLSSRMDIIVFIYAFAWIFVLSSVIPSVILGKERSVLIQFFVCLTLAFVAFAIQDALTNYGGGLSDQLFSLAKVFDNPVLATGYLLMPYLLMLILDIRSRRRQKKKKELENVATAYLENAVVGEQKLQEVE